MRKILMLAVALGVLACGRPPQNSQLEFYSGDSNEALLKYTSTFQIPISELSQPYPKAKKVKDLKPEDQKKLREVRDLHVLHLYGVFTYHEKPIDFSSYSGAPKGSKRAARIKRLWSDKKRMHVEYAYEDRVVFYHEMFDYELMEIEFLMPIEPTTIYKKGFPKKPEINPKTKEPINPCTSKGDNSDLAFWYYWSPDRKGCPKSFRRHLRMVKGATLELLESTESTYPNYDRLFAADEGEYRIDVLLGPDESMTKPNDLGRKTFESNFAMLKAMKTRDGRYRMSASRDEKDYKQLSYETDLFSAKINLHFLDTETEKFDAAARDALKNSDVMIFSGHSYEGYYLDLERLFPKEKKPLPSKEQVFFFNACTTYSYYNENYFDKKPGGAKNLDIVGNVIGSPFLVEGKRDKKAVLNADTILLSAFLGVNQRGHSLRTMPSWQTILDQIAANAGFDLTSLTVVVGDDVGNPDSSPVEVPRLVAE